MSGSVRLLIVVLDTLRLGLPLAVVERVVRAAEVTPLADAPTSVLGVVNVHGEIVPVLDLRERFRLPPRRLRPGHQFVLLRLAARVLAIVVDEAAEVVAFDPQQMVPAIELMSWLEKIQGVIRLEDGLLVVNDPEHFLDADDWDALAGAMEADA